MQWKRFVLPGLMMMTVIHSFSQQQPLPLPKKAPGVLKADVLLLKKILEANHPSLYWFTSKDSIDYYFNYTVNSITDSLDEVQFKNKLAWVVSKIKCGHTSVRFSKAYGKKASQYRYPQFPLAIKAWDDSLIVLASAYANDTVFTRGTVIKAINGKTNRQLLDTLYQYISTDGDADNYKSQLISLNFPGWYKTVLGMDSVYTINYIDSTGKEAVATIRSYAPARMKRDSLVKDIPQTVGPLPTKKQLRAIKLRNKRMMEIDTASSTAYIRLATFSSGRLGQFFRRSFRTIRRMDIKNVMIDVRENGGGNVSASIRLIQYLTDRPFRVGDSVVAISRKFKYGRYIHPSLKYWMAMNFTAHKKSDGRIHYGYYETHLYQPGKKNHFNGTIYLVQGGLTFSAASMFTATLKGQKNVHVIGEETGGGYYGNSAMHIPTIILPNSGLQVSLPMYRLVMDSGRPKGHGVIPDVEIKPSSDAIRKGIDLKLAAVKQAIQQNKP